MVEARTRALVGDLDIVLLALALARLEAARLLSRGVDSRALISVKLRASAPDSPVSSIWSFSPKKTSVGTSPIGVCLGS